MNYLGLSHFKCFESVNVPLNSLTVLAGANGLGKSTCIQGVLLMRKAIEMSGTWYNKKYQPRGEFESIEVPLNGLYKLLLGTASGLINSQDSSEILLSLHNESSEVSVLFKLDGNERKVSFSLGDLDVQGDGDLDILNYEFYYLSAERLGPRISSSIIYWDFPSAGVQGETTAQLIDLDSGFFKVDERRRFKDTESLYLKDQVNYWLDYLMPGVKVKTETNYSSLTARLLVEPSFSYGEATLITNFGFGLSYLLPIIANGLVASAGSLYIIENPEAHLHPSAQSRVGMFLAKVASCGVRILIETHSDHVLSGMQIAVKEGVLAGSDVTVNFFSRNMHDSQPMVSSIGIGSNGNLSDWPKGFFDQIQIDYAKIFNSK